jgi:hypothetical protein
MAAKPTIKIEGPHEGLRPGAEFEFTASPSNKAPSTFTAITPERVIVSHYFTDIQGLPADTPVVAHWHGRYRTEAFLSTVGELAAKAASGDRAASVDPFPSAFA